MNWEVQLAGDTAVLKELSKCLTNNELHLEERNGKFFLRSTRFNALSKSEDVEAACAKLLPLLTGSARLALGGKTPITLAGITNILEDGRRVLYVSVSFDICAGLTISAETHPANNKIEYLYPAQKVHEWVKLGFSNEKVAKALRLFGTKEHDWVGLYRLYEVIEEDVGNIKKIAAKNWAAKNR